MLIAHFLSNISSKIYQNQLTHAEVTTSQKWNVFGRSFTTVLPMLSDRRLCVCLSVCLSPSVL